MPHSAGPALPGRGCRPNKNTTQTGLGHVDNEGNQNADGTRVTVMRGEAP